MQDAEEFTPLHPDVLSAPEMADWVQSSKKKIGEVEMQKESSPSWRLTRGSASGGAGSSGAEKGEACHLLPGLLPLLLLVGCHWHAGWIGRDISDPNVILISRRAPRVCYISRSFWCWHYLLFWWIDSWICFTCSTFRWKRCEQVRSQLLHPGWTLVRTFWAVLVTFALTGGFLWILLKYVRPMSFESFFSQLSVTWFQRGERPTTREQRTRRICTWGW